MRQSEDPAPIGEAESAFFADIYERYYPVMKRQGMMILHHPASADDAIQSAFLRILGKYELLSSLHEAQLVCYLVRSVKFAAIDMLRRRSTEHEQTDLGEIAEDIPDRNTPERQCEQRESNEQLVVALDRLPDALRDLVLYKYFLAIPNTHLAKIFSTSEENIRQRLSRARRRLLEMIGGQDEQQK